MPDEFNGQPVRFLSTYFGSVTYEEAFPLGDQPPEVLPYIAFQLWGRPLSRPTPDPNNPDRIYQRFEYGVMAFDASTGTTTSLPLGAYFKAILTGENLPADLAAAAQGSRFLGQYQPGAPRQRWRGPTSCRIATSPMPSWRRHRPSPGTL